MTLANVLDKNLLDTLLKEMANRYRKIDTKGYQSVEIIIVGGGSVVLNYGFRSSTMDLDAIINASDVIKDIAKELSNVYNISTHWFNSDFKYLSSYSDRLLEVSEHYKSYNDGKFTIRTIKSEYLVAMKMKSGRLYNNDIPDVIGILATEKRNGNEISYDQIENAISFLYGNNTEIDQDIISFVKAFCEMSENELWNEYDKMLNTTQLVNEEVTQDEFREVIKGKQDAKELSAKIFLKHKGN